MNLHEYQAKQLFQRYGLAVAKFAWAKTPEEIDAALDTIGGDSWVIKAQVHAGGRGKGGGVKVCVGREQARAYASGLLGKRLVTPQTDARGQPVSAVLVESPCAIARELYLGAVVDRSAGCVVIMASTEGGMEIETVAHTNPEKILKAKIHPLVGLQAYQARELAFGLNLQGEAFKQFGVVAAGLARLFKEQDLSLVEINPLVVTSTGQLLCLDGKITIDDNALFRHPDLLLWQDATQEDERERHAKQWDLNYIRLDGAIGCMVNGAGLAMATMDLIKLHGSSPANFLDVGGTATQERVAEAFKIIISDPNVKGILVNIFGGIVRCDLIAEGILGAVKEVGVTVPLVVRLEGNQAERGLEILRSSGLPLTTAQGLTDAAEKIVALVGGAS